MVSYSRKIAIRIQSRTENLQQVRNFVAEAAREFGFSDDETSNIVLSVDEACTNIIKHAYQFATDRHISIDILRERNSFEVRIQDNGKPFDPESIRTPDLKEHLSHYRRGGLGVYLMRRLMDRVEYNFVPGKVNEVRLVKNLSPASMPVRR
ncbi:MAG: ATP-binding protein [Ignavibacteriales bacterium]|nr:ATP-binding protein [Ignavibacteriales bacterium]